MFSRCWLLLFFFLRNKLWIIIAATPIVKNSLKKKINYLTNFMYICVVYFNIQYKLFCKLYLVELSDFKAIKLLSILFGETTFDESFYSLLLEVPFPKKYRWQLAKYCIAIAGSYPDNFRNESAREFRCLWMLPQIFSLMMEINIAADKESLVVLPK